VVQRRQIRHLGTLGAAVRRRRRRLVCPQNVHPIKIARATLDSGELLARFEQERQILASFDHPNIARLIDGGTTPDGLSYLVMGYVDGHPIDVYCDEHQMDIAARLLGFVGDLLAIFAAPNRLQHVTTEAGFTEMAISLANSALAGAEALQLISTHITAVRL